MNNFIDKDLEISFDKEVYDKEKIRLLLCN